MIVTRHGDRMTLSEYRLIPDNDGVWDLIDRVLEKQPLATVPEYWMVDPDNEVILVLELSGGHYAERAFSRGDTLITSAMPGFELPSERIFGDPILEQLRSQQDDGNAGPISRGG